MDVIDCNNHVKTASNFFGPSCAVNCLTDKYNPIGDNSDKLCRICTGTIPGKWCTDADPYAGFDGAFRQIFAPFHSSEGVKLMLNCRCLLEAGEVAFLKHTSVPELIKTKEFGKAFRRFFEKFTPMSRIIQAACDRNNLICFAKMGVDVLYRISKIATGDQCLRTPSWFHRQCLLKRAKSFKLFCRSSPKGSSLCSQPSEPHRYIGGLRYGKNPKHLDSTTREPEFDNFGNRLLSTQDRYNSRTNQPEYDTYSSRNSQRFRRQNYNPDG